MKSILVSLTAASILVFSASAKDGAEVAEEKTYILAKKNHLPPVGSVLESSEGMTLKEGKMQMNLQGQPMDGMMSISENASEKVEVLAADKLRYTLVKGESQQKMVMMGQPMPAENQAKAIVGKSILISKKDGKWSGALEEGKANVQEEKEIKAVAEQYNNNSDHKVYGDTPRKIGEEWEVDGSDMMGFEDMEGKVKVKFVKVEKFNDVDCAVLDCQFDVSGSPEELKGVTMTVAGKVKVHRSLRDLVDLSAHFTGSMMMDGKMAPQPGMEIGMKMKGQMTMKSGTKVTRP